MAFLKIAARSLELLAGQTSQVFAPEGASIQSTAMQSGVPLDTQY
jgi:hypothetical protein